jgi:hypothetical protein
MLAVDAFLVVLVLAIIGGVVVVAMQRNTVKARNLPNAELARAVRILDRILAVDDAVPQLPKDLRDEAKRLTSTYYRELEP